MRKMRISNKNIAFLISIVLILTITVGGTLAYIATHTPGITNTFTPGEISGDIIEDITGGIKKDVQVKNTGDGPCYVRVNVVVNWQNNNGDVHAEIPVEGTDYTITFHTDSTNWFEGSDGYYYYKYAIVPNDVTAGSLLTCESNTINGEYYVGVDIMAQCIMATTLDVETAWPAVEVEGDVIGGPLKSK